MGVSMGTGIRMNIFFSLYRSLHIYGCGSNGKNIIVLFTDVSAKCCDTY